MKNYLGTSIKVPLEDLYLDPHNPRLAPDDAPGYDNPSAIFEPGMQMKLQEAMEDGNDLESLEQAIVGQGWMPIDAIVVWHHSDEPGKYIVVEGNRRLSTLRRVRDRLVREADKLARMRSKGAKTYAKSTIDEQTQLVSQLEAIIDDTNNLDVLPLEAKDLAQLRERLPRVLAVRHISGPRKWGNYAADVWLLDRYAQLYEDDFPGEDLKWKPDLIHQVADEASISAVKAKRQLKAASCYSHFKAEYETELPADQDFVPPDYFLFVNIVKSPWLRDRFGLGEDDIHLGEDGERAIFAWSFQKPHLNLSVDENENVFSAHRHVSLWHKMKQYDDVNHTTFAQRFNVDDPTSAPRMVDVEVDYMNHKQRRNPAEVIDQLLSRLGEIKAETITREGRFLRVQVEALDELTSKLLKMIDAAG